MPRIRNTEDGPVAQATVVEEQRRHGRRLDTGLCASPLPGDSETTKGRLERIRSEISIKTADGKTELRPGELKAYRDEIQRLRYWDWKNQRRTG